MLLQDFSKSHSACAGKFRMRCPLVERKLSEDDHLVLTMTELG